ncbi:MAG: phosphatase PAP2 family protein [Nitratireductor sp.]
MTAQTNSLSRNKGATRGETGRIFLAAMALFVVFTVVFALWPQLDILVSSLYHEASGKFAYSVSGFWRGLRTVFLRGFALWYVVITVSLWLSISKRERILGLDWRNWLYLLLCSVTGPLLLTNIILKEHWGRWRPHEVMQFGGKEQFAWPLDWSGSCADNCSFVSGEVSSATMAFFAVALISAMPVRRWLYGLSAVFWAVSALMRIGQGGHFLSDTIFAGLFMMLIATALHRWLFSREDGQPLFPADPGEAARMVAATHDRLWKSVCNAGLALLDRIAPRR